MAHRVGLLIAGGDAPGLNVCMKALVNDATERGYEVVGIRKGWEGLLNINPASPSTEADNAMILTRTRVRDIDRTPGSFLHSSRLIPASVSMADTPRFLRPAGDKGPFDLTPHICATLDRFGIEALVVLGDNPALAYAARLSAEGVPVIAIPKSVHNDVPGSDYCLGFSSALARGVHLIHEVRAMAGSREEIAVVEVFGRSGGLTTLIVGALAGADRTLVPEVAFDPDHLARLLHDDKRANASNYAILAMGESVRLTAEAAPRYRDTLEHCCGENEELYTAPDGSCTIAGRRSPGLGATSAGPVVTEVLEKLLGERILFQPLSYLLRSGEPDGQDLLGARNFAALSMSLLAEGKTGRMVAYRRQQNYVDVPIAEVTRPDGNQNVATFYNAATLQANAGIFWAARI